METGVTPPPPFPNLPLLLLLLLLLLLFLLCLTTQGLGKRGGNVASATHPDALTDCVECCKCLAFLVLYQDNKPDALTDCGEYLAFSTLPGH